MRRLAVALLMAVMTLAPALAARGQASDRVVTVTLVRWPYT